MCLLRGKSKDLGTRLEDRDKELTVLPELLHVIEGMASVIASSNLVFLALSTNLKFE